jgi:hypothetical protein
MLKPVVCWIRSFAITIENRVEEILHTNSKIDILICWIENLLHSFILKLYERLSIFSENFANSVCAHNEIIHWIDLGFEWKMD